MELVKLNWNKDEIKKLDNLLYGKKLLDKVEWTTKIVNTKMKVLAIPIIKLDEIVKEISKGDIEGFIKCYFNENLEFTYHENTIIYAKLLCKVQNFEIFKNAIMYFSNIIDNWASCDAINGKLKWDKNQLLDLSRLLIKSDKEFARRVGFRLLFSIIGDDFIDEIFDLMKLREYEDRYYVNMIIAWLMAECFIKQKEKTIEFMKVYKNRFALNKAISKCHDSYRVSKEDKNMLKSFRIN